MTFQDYEESAAKTAIYPSTDRITYPTLGLNGEAGEIAEKVKKMIRDDYGVLHSEVREELKKEVGDVLWYLAALSHDLGFTLSDAARANLDKLRDRQQRGVLGGSGDNR